MPVLAASQSSAFGSVPMLVIIAVLFGGLIYMQVRARKRVAAKQAALVTDLAIGSKVVMISGLKGTVAGVSKDEVEVEIAPGVISTFVTKAIGSIENPTNAAGDSTVDRSNQMPGDDIIGSGKSDPESPITEN